MFADKTKEKKEKKEKKKDDQPGFLFWIYYYSMWLLVIILAGFMAHATYDFGMHVRYKVYFNQKLAELRDPVDGGFYEGSETKVSYKIPWFVVITQSLLQTKVNLVCGGTVISSEWILTDLSCTKRFHKRDLRLEFAGNISISRRVEDIYTFGPHEMMKVIGPPVALLRLTEPLDLLESGIRPICFAPEEENYGGTLGITIAMYTQRNGMPMFRLAAADIDAGLNCKSLSNIYYPGTEYLCFAEEPMSSSVSATSGMYCESIPGMPLMIRAGTDLYSLVGVRTAVEGTCRSTGFIDVRSFSSVLLRFIIEHEEFVRPLI